MTKRAILSKKRNSPSLTTRSSTISVTVASTSSKQLLKQKKDLLEGTIHGGTIHKDIPLDLCNELSTSASALIAWNDITPLARNEFLCWISDAKQKKTREKRIIRAREELEEGMRRPCCWPGCKHRKTW